MINHNLYSKQVVPNRWLMSTGQGEKSVAIMKRIAKINKKEVGHDLIMLAMIMMFDNDDDGYDKDCQISKNSRP